MFSSSNCSFLLFLSSVFVVCFSEKLPNFITPCKLYDPQLSECALNEARKVYPELINGDKKLGIPKLAPFHIPAVNIDSGGNLRLGLKDITLNGLDKIKFQNITIDPEKKTTKITVSSDELSLKGTYTIDGQLLVLPLKGNGPGFIRMKNGVYKYSFEYNLIKKQDGKEYMKIVNPLITYEVERTMYKFDNLFNGDKLLGDQMNKFINDNYKELSKDFHPIVAKTISSIATQVAAAIFEKVPYNEVYIH